MKVWDLPTRLYHWLQALLFFLLLCSGLSGNGPHELLGIGLMVLIMWRVVWGFIGSETSQFSHFVRSPRTIWRYLRGLESHHIGHNPAGGWMVVALLFLLTAQCLFGMLLAGFFDNMISSESLLANTALIGDLHSLLARLLILFIVLHLLAIITYKILRKPLVKAMLTGYQEKLSHNPNVKFVPTHRALMVLAFSCALMLIVVPI